MSREEPKTKAEYLAWVASQPTSAWGAPSNKSIAVLYSGYQRENHKAAQKDCEPPDSPRYLIDDTTGGLALAAKLKESGLDPKETEEVWRSASARFAQNIEGPVETHLISSDKNAIAQGTELAMINADNSRVTTINGHDREEIADLAGSSSTDAYYAICNSELAQTQERAAQADDPEVAARLNKLADDKETGLQAVVGRDMAWNAQHSADPSAPDEGVRFKTEPREGTEQVPPPANNDYVKEEQDQTTRVGESTLTPANDNYQAKQQWDIAAPGDIPSPNEFSPVGPVAPAADVPPPPDDGVPPPARNQSVANDNSLDGPG